MGSQNMCCAQQQALGGTAFFTLQGSTPAEKPITLSSQQQAFIHSKNPFPNQLKKTVTLRMTKDDLFEGQLDEKGNPVGFGIFKTKDEEAIYFGKFSELGTESGKIFYVMPNGSHFEGNLMAESGIKGIYVQPQHGYRYDGELQHRPGQYLRYLPHGTGTEKSRTYEFTGKFQTGKRVQGKLKWICGDSSDQYEGSFDQNEQFSGKGVLKQKTGVYTGDFVKGIKEGQGRYVHFTDLTYEGGYRDGKKNGLGRLLNSDGTSSYEGEFKDGVPHGNGVAYWKDKAVQSQFFGGIKKEDFMFLIEETNRSQNIPTQVS